MIQIEYFRRKNRVKITGGNSFFEINSIPGENYPSLPLLAGEKSYRLPQYIFRDLISKTAFAAAVNAQRLFLTAYTSQLKTEL